MSAWKDATTPVTSVTAPTAHAIHSAALNRLVKRNATTAGMTRRAEHHEDTGHRHRERDDDPEKRVEEKIPRARPGRVVFSQGHRQEGLPKDEIDHADNRVGQGHPDDLWPGDPD